MKLSNIKCIYINNYLIELLEGRNFIYDNLEEGTTTVQLTYLDADVIDYIETDNNVISYGKPRKTLINGVLGSCTKLKIDEEDVVSLHITFPSAKSNHICGLGYSDTWFDEDSKINN